MRTLAARQPAYLLPAARRGARRLPADSLTAMLLLHNNQLRRSLNCQNCAIVCSSYLQLLQINKLNEMLRFLRCFEQIFF